MSCLYEDLIFVDVDFECMVCYNAAGSQFLKRVFSIFSVFCPLRFQRTVASLLDIVLSKEILLIQLYLKKNCPGLIKKIILLSRVTYFNIIEGHLRLKILI